MTPCCALRVRTESVTVVDQWVTVPRVPRGSQHWHLQAAAVLGAAEEPPGRLVAP